MKKYIASQLPAEYEQLDSILGGDGTNLNNVYLNTNFKCSDFYGCEIELCMRGNLRENNKWHLNGAYEPRGKLHKQVLLETQQQHAMAIRTMVLINQHIRAI